MITKTLAVLGIAVAMSGLGPAARADESAHSMVGCLREGAAPGSFVLTDLGLADGPATVEIPSATVDLAPHKGHKVELTGTTVAGSSDGVHAMHITAMKHLAASCP